MGGTFDPIHYGHLVAAEMARTEFGLGRVLFMPTGTPPHKAGQRITPAESRLAMVELAIADNPSFEASRLEIERQGPSYTVDTLRQLKQARPEDELYFITGTDALRDLFSWHEPREILHLAHFIAASRPGFAAESMLEQASDDPLILTKVHLLEVPALAISSTDIRQRVSRGRSIRYLLPETVRDYIVRHRLYF